MAACWGCAAPAVVAAGQAEAVEQDRRPPLPAGFGARIDLARHDAVVVAWGTAYGPGPARRSHVSA